MLLLEKVKILRREFPHIRIRQLNDENNRKYALFILPHCAENMKLFFERDFMVLEFYGSKTFYGYPKSEFKYLIVEIRNLLECRTLVVSVECGGTVIDSFIASADEINDGFLASEAARCCLNRGISEPKSVFVNLYYCDSCLDRTEYYSCLSKKFM